MKRSGLAKKLIVPSLLIAYILFLYLAAKLSWVSLSAAVVFAVLGIVLTVAIKLAVSQFLTKSVSRFINAHKKGSLLFLTAVSVAAVFSICYFIAPIGAFLGIKNIDVLTNVFKGADLFTYYTAQLSITFISISVLSVLSDKSVIIYWANVSEDRLIKPTFNCFAAYTYYSIGATLGSGLGVVLNNGLVFAAFFVVNILVMIALTASMVDVYYGRDAKIKKLQKELAADYYKSRRKDINLSAEEYPPVFSAKYREKMLGLRQHLYNSYDNNDLSELKEMYELYGACPDLFYSKDGETAVKTIVETVDGKTMSIFVSSLLRGLHVTLFNAECDEVRRRRTWHYKSRKSEKKQSSWEYEYALYIDKPLWKALSDDQFISLIRKMSERKSPMSEKALRDLLLCVKNRVAIIYNCEVLNKQGEQKSFGFKGLDYLVDTSRWQSIVPRLRGAESKTRIEIEKIEEIFSEYKNYSLYDASNSDVLECLLKITHEILNVLPDSEDELEDFPYHKVLM